MKELLQQVIARSHEGPALDRRPLADPVRAQVAMARSPFLELRGIGKTYPGVTALDGGQPVASRRGEVVGLIGENGAGK